MKIFDYWYVWVIVYMLSYIVFTQFYKISTKSSKGDGDLTILLQLIAVIITLLFLPFFKFVFPTNWKVYLFLGIAIIFYTLADRMFTTVRAKIEASTFGIIKQVSTVMMIFAGILFFKEEFVLTKILGAFLIIFSNVIIFYDKKIRGNVPNKYILLAILANLSFTAALFTDVNISESFNLAFYVAITFLIPALLIFVFERIKISNLKKEFINGNKTAIVITGICWSISTIAGLKAYQLGQISIVAPLLSLTVIGNIIIGYFFLNEKTNLIKKLVAAILIVIAIILIKL